MQHSIVFSLSLTVVFFLGCAGAPSPGDSMKAHGSAAEQLGKRWNQGEKLLKRGEKMQKQSSKLSKEAEEKQAKSEELIEKGK